MLTLAIVLGFLLCSWLVSALLVRRVMRRVGAEKPTFLRAVGILLVILLVSLPFTAGGSWLAREIPADEPGRLLGSSLGLLAAQVVLDWLLIGRIVGVSFGKAVLVWLAAALGGAASLGVLFFVVKPYAVEAFVVPTNSMAPTVLGWHQTRTCPHCGGPLTVGVHLPEDGMPAHVDDLGICGDCRKISEVSEPPISDRHALDLYSPDRIIANKLLGPCRWDLVVYRTPMDPRVKYVKRLVGLPGETVVIREGAVWIDGVKQTPPAEVAGLEYTSTDQDDRPMKFATGANPTKLADGECFVLGDFTRRAADSRYYGPVPWENIEGVVGARYYPLDRWKLWR